MRASAAGPEARPPASIAVPGRDWLLALAVMAVWGSNFVVIKWGLAELPPFLLATLRFGLAAVPLVFVLPRPPVGWGNLAAYGVLIGVGQFGLLFLAMRGLISPGLASLVVQLQAFFTMGLALLLAGERPCRYQVVALGIALAGMGVIAFHADGDTTVAGLLLVALAGFCWAAGNMVSRAAARGGARVNMVAYVVWSSLFAVPPLLALSLGLEGWPRIAHSLAHASWGAWATVAWQAWGNSVLGYGAWAWLLGRYSAASIAPLSLLVPVFGMGASSLLLAEPLPPWKLAAAALVLLGLALNVGWPALRARLRGAAR